jgi:RNA polymerase sigma-70 factor (ECF subfamily)
MDPTETNLIARIKAGDNEAFAELYDQYVEKIYHFIYFRTLHQQLAEDLTSQAFLNAYQRFETFDPSRGNFSSWLYRIARNQIIDQSRRTKPTDDILTHEHLQSGDDPVQDTDRQLNTEQLQKLLAKLPEEQRELVIMRLWDELPYTEIAILTGKTESSLRMQFSRIVGALRQHAHLLLLTLIYFKL